MAYVRGRRTGNRLVARLPPRLRSWRPAPPTTLPTGLASMLTTHRPGRSSCQQHCVARPASQPGLPRQHTRLPPPPRCSARRPGRLGPRYGSAVEPGPRRRFRARRHSMGPTLPPTGPTATRQTVRPAGPASSPPPSRARRLGGRAGRRSRGARRQPPTPDASPACRVAPPPPPRPTIRQPGSSRSTSRRLAAAARSPPAARRPCRCRCRRSPRTTAPALCRRVRRCAGGAEPGAARRRQDHQRPTPPTPPAPTPPIRRPAGSSWPPPCGFPHPRRPWPRLHRRAPRRRLGRVHCSCGPAAAYDGAAGARRKKRGLTHPRPTTAPAAARQTSRHRGRSNSARLTCA